MKKLFTLLSLVFILASCSPEITRFAYKDNPLQYKDVETNGELKVHGKYAYLKTSKGTPMVVDLDIFTIERVNSKTITPIQIKSDTTYFFREYNNVVTISYKDFKN